MILTLRKIFVFIKKIGLLFPLRLNFFLLLMVLYFLKLYVQPDLQTEDIKSEEVYRNLEVFKAIYTFIQQFFILIFIFSFITLLFSFLQNNQHKNTSEYLHFDINLYFEDGKGTNLKVKIINIYRAFLGKVYFAVISKKNDISKNELTRISKNTYNSYLPLDFHYVKRYYFENEYVMFRDLFNLFQFYIHFKENQTFTKRAEKTNNIVENRIRPNKANENLIRINNLRKVDGEWLQYKKYESSDDLRRIVWKVYAKNRELIVRQVENQNPYASHLDFYISFLAENDSFFISNELMQDFLTTYKNICWSVFEEFQQKFENINFISDQKISNIDSEDLKSYNHELISASEWINKPNLSDSIHTNGEHILCISPFVNHADLRIYCEKYKNKTTIYLIIPEIISKKSNFNWIKNILFKNNNFKNNTILQIWKLGKMNSKYKLNVKALEKILIDNNIPFEKIIQSINEYK